MASLLSPETFEFFARYLLAGYVVIFVRSGFILGLRPKPAELLIEAVILSLIVQLIVLCIGTLHGWIISFPIASNLWGWLRSPPERLEFTFRILMVPMLLGWILGKFLQSGWRNNLLRRFSLPVVHPVRRAHDFAFGRDRSPGLVEITYEDGTKIGGWFGENSLAATDDNRTDLYLERAYVISAEGNWSEPRPPRSVLISLAGVRSIEFLLPEEHVNDE